MWKYGSVFKSKLALLGGHRHIVSFDSFGAFENQSSSWLVQGSLPKQTNPGRVPQQCVSWSCASAAPCKSCPTAEQCSSLNPPADTEESCDLGGFLSSRTWADVEPTRKGCWWHHFCLWISWQMLSALSGWCTWIGSISSCHCLSAGVWDLKCCCKCPEISALTLQKKEVENSLCEDGAAGLISFVWVGAGSCCLRRTPGTFCDPTAQGGRLRFHFLI